VDLLACCDLELHYQFSGYPPAVLHVDALGLGPLAYLGGVRPACRFPAGAAGRPQGSAADPLGSTDVAGLGIPQLLGVPDVQVDLVLLAVQAEADVSLGGTAVEVIADQVPKVDRRAADYLAQLISRSISEEQPGASDQ
jgi:hypothetical protein